MAREMGKSCTQRGIAIHYPLLSAAGYTGLLVWHGGLSGTAPLKVTQIKDLIGIFGPDFVNQHHLKPLLLSETIGSTLNLFIMGLLLICVPLCLIAMLPKQEDRKSYDEYHPNTDYESSSSLPKGSNTLDQSNQLTPAQKLEHSRFLAWGFSILIGLYAFRYLQKIGIGAIDLNVINLIFIGLGFAVYASPLKYARAVEKATRGCSGILIQFPLYAGIMAVMSQSGLTQMIAHHFTQFASADSLSGFTFLSSGLINLCVPSGGGQWAVQGPLILQSAYDLGAPLGEVVMAFAYGDAWTNMLQPFWALPLLVITGVQAKEIVGYSATLMVMIIPIYFLGFWLF